MLRKRTVIDSPRYDSRSQLLEEAQVVEGGPVRVASSRYINAGERFRLEYPTSGDHIDYDYDDHERVRDMNWNDVNLVQYDYIGWRVMERRYQNGVKLRYHDNASPGPVNIIGYDSRRRVVSHNNVFPAGTTLATFDYQYDRADNRTRIDRPHETSGNQDNLTYDSAYRMLTFQRSGATTVTWTLDGVQNWQTKTDGSGTTTYTLDTGGLNEYASITHPGPVNVAQTFDANG